VSEERKKTRGKRENEKHTRNPTGAEEKEMGRGQSRYKTKPLKPFKE